MNPFISFIVPVYNVESYLAKCVDSICGQSFRNIEIMLVDDGSTDSSPSLCDSFASADNRIRVIHKNNGGLGYARNSGIDAAKGDFIVFVDSDDWIGMNLAQTISDLVTGRNFDFIEFGLLQTDEEARHTGMRLPKIRTGAFNREQVINEVLPDYLRDAGPRFSNSACNHVYSGKLIREKGLRFHSEREIYAEDFLFNLEYMLHVSNAYVTDELFYYYRINQGSLTRSFRENYLEAVCRRDEVVRKVLSENRLEQFSGYVTEKFIRISPVFVFNAMLLKKSRGRKVATDEISKILGHPSLRSAIKSFNITIFPLKLRPVYWLMKRNKPGALFFLLSIISVLRLSKRYNG